MFGNRIRVLREAGWAEWSSCRAVREARLAALAVPAGWAVVVAVVRRWFRRFGSGLCLGHRHRLRRAAAVRAAHRQDARRGRGVRRQVPLAV